MKKHALMVILLGAIALLVAVLASPGRAAAQPQPTMVIVPSSGPCDATVEVRGSGFPPASGVPPFRALPETLRLYLVQPGTADVNMEILNPAFVDQDGTFSAWAPLWKRGCEAAALDSQAEQPSGSLFIVASSTFEESGVGPGERIPNIIAVAQYAYTTTTPHVPTETLQISPASGPCDGTVEVAGSGFDPGTEVRLKLARPGSDDTLGTLASATADGAGEFVVQFALGDLGCRAAQMNMIVGDPTQPQLGIAAYAAAYPTPGPGGIPPALAGVLYRYTTTEVSGSVSPRALPATGSGPGDPSVPLAWLWVTAVLAGVGLILVVASLYRGRLRVRR
jgi:hypothetical protein